MAASRGTVPGQYPVLCPSRDQQLNTNFPVALVAEHSAQPYWHAPITVSVLCAGRSQELSALQKQLAASKDSHAALHSQLRQLTAQAGNCTGQLQALEAVHQGSEGRAQREVGRALELEAALQEAAHLLHALQVRRPVPP